MQNSIQFDELFAKNPKVGISSICDRFLKKLVTKLGWDDTLVHNNLELGARQFSLIFF